jgi:tetratricopeptide (TPR) repeat protein
MPKLALACGLILAPVLARNWLAGRELTLTTSSAGMNFYVGNHPGATGIYAQVDFVPSAEPDQEREGFAREAERRLGRLLTPAGVSAYWLGEGWRYIREQPGSYLHLLWRKFTLFWNAVESQNNLSYYFGREWVPFLGRTLDWGWMAPLGLAGWAVWGRRRREVMLEIYALAYLAGCLVFFVSSEYRLPLVPVLLLWAALGGCEARRALRVRQWRELAGAGAALALLALFVNRTDPFVERLRSLRVDYHNFAVLYERAGNVARAAEMARRCLAIDPDFGPARRTLARLEQGAGLNPEAEGEAARALRLYEEGDYRGAAEAFASLVSQAPDQERLHNSLGLCHYKLGEHELAEASYGRALSLNPAYAVTHYNLGLLRLAQGRPQQGVASLKQALSLDPGYRVARFKLGEVLARQGDPGGALALWEELLAQLPGDEGLRARVDSLRQAVRGGRR